MTITAKSVRRIVAGNDDTGKAIVIGDAPSPDVHTDPARPGFYATRLWVTDSTPVKTKGVRESLHLPHTIEPPSKGSVFRYYEFPPESTFIGKIGAHDVEEYFYSMGSPAASTYTKDTPHPYMQKTETLDFCYILKGNITLILDLEEVHLREGDTVIQRGTNHSWSNRSNQPCVVVVSSHDGQF